jgi:hypothetical protein
MEHSKPYYDKVDRWEISGENITFYDEKGNELDTVPVDAIIGAWLSQERYNESVRQRILSASKKMKRVV